MLRFLHNLWADMRAVALIEFAIVFPILFVLLFGGIEVGRNILITLKVEKAGYVLTDILSQYAAATGSRVAGEINTSTLDTQVFPQFSTIMGSYADDEKQRVIFTAVRKDAGVLRLKWQRAGGGTLNDNVISVVNNKTPADMNPATDSNSIVTFSADSETQGFLSTVAPGETFIVGEVFFHYTPILRFILYGITGIFGPDHSFYLDERVIVKRMYFRPRAGDLVCLPEDFLHDECQLKPSQHALGCSCNYSSSQRVTNCGRSTALIHDYYRCGDGTTREYTSPDTPNLAGCSGSDYGNNIEEVARSFLNGSCVNP